MPDGLPNVPPHLLQVPKPTPRWVQFADAWLVDDWRYAWKFASVIAATALAGVDFAMTHLDVLAQLLAPDTIAQLGAVLPADRLVAVNKYAALALIVLRLVRQDIPARDAAPAPAAPASQES